MGIKDWFEKKKLERDAKKAQREALAKVSARPRSRISDHSASKRGHKHLHGEGFITSVHVTHPEDGHKMIVYKHGPNYGKTIASNHERCLAGRRSRIFDYPV